MKKSTAKKYVPARVPPNFKKRVKNNSLPKSLFTGKYRRNEYKQVWWEGRSQGAHVVAWKKKYGNNSIPPGYIVHHKKGTKFDPNPSIKNLSLMPKSDHSRMSGGIRYAKDGTPTQTQSQNFQHNGGYED